MILSFWSQGGNVGKSILALITAKFLGQKGNKVVLLDLNLKTPSQAIYHNDNRNFSIDEILCYYGYDEIKKVINSNTASYDDHDVIYGTKVPEKCLYVKLEPVMDLINHIESMYSNIVIDTCSDIDNAGTYCALTKSDIVFVVLNQNVKDLILLQKNEVFRIITKEKKKVYLLNCYREELKLTVDEIKNILSIDDELYVLPEFSKEMLDVINSRALNNVSPKELKPFFDTLDAALYGSKEVQIVKEEKKQNFLGRLFAISSQPNLSRRG